MANFMYLEAKHKLASAQLNLASADIRCLLVGPTSTCPSQKTATTLAGFTPLAELSGTGYVRKTVAGKALAKDTPNLRVELTATDIVWTALDAGTALGALFYVHVTDDSDSYPLFWVDTGGFPVVTNGEDMTLFINAEGVWQL